MKIHQLSNNDYIDTILDEVDNVSEFNLLQGGTSFKIKFTPAVDKQNDFTVSQNKRISAA